MCILWTLVNHRVQERQQGPFLAILALDRVCRTVRKTQSLLEEAISQAPELYLRPDDDGAEET